MLSALLLDVVQVGDRQRYCLKQQIHSEDTIAVIIRLTSSTAPKKASPSSANYINIISHQSLCLPKLFSAFLSSNPFLIDFLPLPTLFLALFLIIIKSYSSLCS